MPMLSISGQAVSILYTVETLHRSDATQWHVAAFDAPLNLSEISRNPTLRRVMILRIL
jgi:hypothetical protein